MVSFFVGLAVWQWERAQEKEQLQKKIDAYISAAPVEISSFENIDPTAYLPVELRGRYLNEQAFLLDNVVNDGKAGFYAISPFKLSNSGEIILVNLGWIAVGPNRNQLPSVVTPLGEVTVFGRLMPPKSRPVIGADMERPDLYVDGLWQYIDLNYLALQLNQPVISWVLQLDPKVADGYQRQWAPFNAKIGMHYGYFLHWLVFALFSVAAYLSLTIKKRRPSE
ncbi:SURF1 family protein [Aestuariirhabdus sp. Z084]|uniref:SURF1 family protein n=1 Tax=Aestuariirhabdus haliotis TaxID=2918751 RepID=UPI00201B3909|nr:SURF1 family protein [Aestuariirhabdus haliotis]MCL6414274.1 SURF1 family protein [Aestuariirhabdus haliotis]MCL6418206.1 SURF1 family protein [Aestuariirhabdus haliotis]